MKVRVFHCLIHPLGGRLFKNLKRFGSSLAFPLLIWVPVDASTVWTVSNRSADSPDFASLDEAVTSPGVEAGDTLLIQSSPDSYGDIEINKPLHLEGSPSDETPGDSPRIGNLTISVTTSDMAVAPLRIDSLEIGHLEVVNQPVRVTASILSGMSLKDINEFEAFGNWIQLEGASILIKGVDLAEFRGNLFEISGSGSLVYLDRHTSSGFSHNTIVDEKGYAEWILYFSTWEYNVVMMPYARLAAFRSAFENNISTRATFREGSNLEDQGSTDLFESTGNSPFKWYPSPSGVSSGSAADGSDYGFTGGPQPFNPEDIPGLSRPGLSPAPPSIEVLSVGWDNVQLLLGKEAPQDQIHIQFQTGDGPYLDAYPFSHGQGKTTVYGLVPSTGYRLRARSAREEIFSVWNYSDLLQTLSRLEFLQLLLGKQLTQESDWFLSTWLGWVYPVEKGFLRHLDHGMLLPEGGPDSLYVYDFNLGRWMWTNSVLYPNLYIFNPTDDWVYYYEGTRIPERWFYHYGSDSDLREGDL